MTTSRDLAESVRAELDRRIRTLASLSPLAPTPAQVEPLAPDIDRDAVRRNPRAARTGTSTTELDATLAAIREATATRERQMIDLISARTRAIYSARSAPPRRR